MSADLRVAGASGPDENPRLGLARAAVAAWREALARPVHGPGCGCCGGWPIKLNSAWLAEDIDHALRARYSAARLHEMIALLDAHPALDGQDLASRIADLAAHDGDQVRVVTVLQDFIDVLSSINPRPSQRR